VLALPSQRLLSIRSQTTRHYRCERAARLIENAVVQAAQEATKAFWKLLDADDALLATPHVRRLLIYYGNQDPGTIRSVIVRMLSSQDTGSGTPAVSWLPSPQWNGRPKTSSLLSSSKAEHTPVKARPHRLSRGAEIE
jgi:hypothetical protein